MSTKHSKFVNRIRIVGSLTLDSELHIGDGGVTPDTAFTNNENQTRRPPDIATIARDMAGNPVVPGAAIKGVLRSYLEKSKSLKPVIDAVFGRTPGTKSSDVQELPGEERGTGGKVEFSYAPLLPLANDDAAETVSDTTNELPVQSSVGINRQTGAAHDRALRSSQYVPRGRAFEVELVGYNLDESEIGLLLHGLDGFDDRERLRLGAGHANQAGLATWELVELHHIQPQDVKHWFATPHADRPDWRDLGKLNSSARKKLEERAAKAIAGKFAKPSRLTGEITLHFDGPFLTNDARSTDDDVDHRPSLTSDGRLLLAARGFRGAFRSHAERIVRTLNGQAAGDPFAKPPGSAAATPSKATPNLIDELFGNTDHRAVLEVSDFVADAPLTATEVQEFVAIDRFTGGAADAKKFNAHFVYRPTLKGRLSILLEDLRPWSLGLLALTVRDLIEGDITFGWGASKGYGACRAEISKISCPIAFDVTQAFGEEFSIDAKSWKSSHKLLHQAAPLDPNLLEPTKSIFPTLLASAVQQLHAKLGITAK
ncbi:MAG: RAMP superfamily CRISPR-associated protein [Planctomycetota bacterium]|nr:RAMP superfamily CRISPR-associated protein [Planctomycetota bacterium]